MNSGERMAKLETDVTYIKEKLDTFIKRADDKYAPKWIVTILSWISGILSALIVIGAVKFIWG